MICNRQYRVMIEAQSNRIVSVRKTSMETDRRYGHNLGAKRQRVTDTDTDTDRETDRQTDRRKERHCKE